MRYLHSVALTKVGDPVHGLSEAERAFRCCVELTEYFAIQYRTAHPDNGAQPAPASSKESIYDAGTFGAQVNGPDRRKQLPLER